MRNIDLDNATVRVGFESHDWKYCIITQFLVGPSPHSGKCGQVLLRVGSLRKRRDVIAHFGQFFKAKTQRHQHRHRRYPPTLTPRFRSDFPRPSSNREHHKGRIIDFASRVFFHHAAGVHGASWARTKWGCIKNTLITSRYQTVSYVQRFEAKVYSSILRNSNLTLSLLISLQF